MMKPYYVQALDSNNNLVDVRYHQSAYDDSLFLYRAIGGSTFGNGFNQMSFTPGVFARAAIRFDWEHFNTGITAVEVGLNAEAYTKKLEIMALNPPGFFYFNAYVSIVLGGRKLR